MLMFSAARTSQKNMAKTESLLLGIIAAFGSLVFVVLVIVVMQIFTMEKNGTISETSLYTPAFIALAILIEELSKYIFIKKKLADWEEKGSTIINAVFFGLGFAAIETIFIFLNSFPEKNAFYGILGIALVHISTAIIIAYSALKYRLTAKSILSLIPAIGLHLAYNFAILYGKGSLTLWISIALIVIISAALIGAMGKKKALA